MRISDWSSDVCSSDLGELPFIRLFRFLGLFGWIAPHRVDGAKTEHDRAAGNRSENDRLFGVDRPVRQGGNLRLALALPLNVFRIGHRLRRKGPVLDRLALRHDVVAIRRIVMIVCSPLTQPLWFARPAPRPCPFYDRHLYRLYFDFGISE